MTKQRKYPKDIIDQATMMYMEGKSLNEVRDYLVSKDVPPDYAKVIYFRIKKELYGFKKVIV
jgi:hypothetical protein